MNQIVLSKNTNISSGTISKGTNRYIDINITNGTIQIKLTKIGRAYTIPTLEGSKFKWDLIDYVSIEFISYDGVVEYKLF